MSTCYNIVRELVDSAADSKLKRLKHGETFGVEKPGGEARIYIGQENTEEELDDFFGFNEDIVVQTFKVSRSDLLDYLLNAKNEFEHPKAAYRLNISELYDGFISMLTSIENDVFEIQFKKNINRHRYYLSPYKEGGRRYSEYIRSICLPLCTNYNFIKSIDDGGKVVYYFKPIFTELSNDTLSKYDTSEYKRCSFPEDDLSPKILYGPPGTGKTFKLQDEYLAHFDKRLAYFTTFHQSFSYEEFVEGLKPTLGDFDNVSYHIEKGVFYRACEKAAIIAGFSSLKAAMNVAKEERNQIFSKAVEDKKLVLLCIDEINRGNVASIFGDLISLIEPSKRLGNKDELILTLPYSKERFGLPSNLMIVGTMNTADRSIQLLDSALRRRFRFEELPPFLDVIKYATAKDVLRAINKRIRAILNKDSQIGHAYFIDVDSEEETLQVIIQKVIPLLEEYFYNDIDKIRFVLNDYGDSAKFYIEDKETKEAYDKYTEVADIDSEEKNFFSLNTDFSIYPAADYIKQIIG